MNNTANMNAGGSSFARRLWIVPVVTVLALAAGFVYLQRATPIYQVSALLALPDASSARTAASQIQSKHSSLEVSAVPQSLLVQVSKSSSDVRGALEQVNAALDAFVKDASTTQPGADDAHLVELKRRRDELTRQSAGAKTALAEVKREHPELASADSAKSSEQRLAELTQAFTAAQLQATDSKAQLDATEPMLTDPRKADDLVNLNRSKGMFEFLDRDRQRIEKDLADARQTLEQQKLALGAQNPARVATQRQIDELTNQLADQQHRYIEVYRTYLEQQWQTAAHKQEELGRLIGQEKKKAAPSGEVAEKHAKLQMDLKRASDSLAAVEKELSDRQVLDSVRASDVRLVQPAQAPTKPVWPNRTLVMAAALGGGVVAGLVLSALATLVGRP